MSLHGTVNVNGHHIAEWQADRVTNRDKGALGFDVVSEYEWWYKPLGGNGFGGTVEHKFSDGAAVLASLVLAKAGRVEHASKV